MTTGIPSYMRWLPGKTTSTIVRCEFLARGMVDGFISGRHRSPKKGFSVEFAEHRQYVPGDDLRNLDWRVLARKDRHYIKQYVEETNLRATILLDCSGSMDYRGEHAAEFDGRKLSKLEYGKYMAAALTYLLIGQQDGVGYVQFDNKIRDFLPPKARASQVRFVLDLLEKAEPGGESAIAPIFDEIAERIPHRGVVIIISDLFDTLEPLLKALHHFKFRRHDVIILHTMAEEELTFPFDSFMHIQDLESPTELQFDPKSIRAHYLENVNAFIDALKGGCSQMQADYVPINTKVPFEKALSDYLAKRRTGVG